VQDKNLYTKDLLETRHPTGVRRDFAISGQDIHTVFQESSKFSACHVVACIGLSDSHRFNASFRLALDTSLSASCPTNPCQRYVH